ncbi:hypothetical protein CQ12_21035 [Bradyrhizobium jicamae]|uniref:Uncharacterized protein n=1 Tax=Bradyrhizobium jicamae TaxID=280332 RepID=A0A0R3KL55_9BRAD|nr:hypothetical protein CQ12_21035 [Bradyrhizobium jicamae]
MKQQHAPEAVSADSFDLGIMFGKHRTSKVRDALLAPTDWAAIVTRQGKPRDLRDAVANRDQRSSTVPAAKDANTGSLPKRHVHDAAHFKSVIVRLTVSCHGPEISVDTTDRITF